MATVYRDSEFLAGSITASDGGSGRRGSRTPPSSVAQVITTELHRSNSAPAGGFCVCTVAGRHQVNSAKGAPSGSDCASTTPASVATALALSTTRPTTSGTTTHSGPPPGASTIPPWCRRGTPSGKTTSCVVVRHHRLLGLAQGSVASPGGLLPDLLEPVPGTTPGALTVRSATERVHPASASRIMRAPTTGCFRHARSRPSTGIRRSRRPAHSCSVPMDPSEMNSR